MLRYVRWGKPFLVWKSCHRVHSHFSTAGKFHYVWKKLPQNKWFAWTKKWTCHWFLPSVSLEKSFSKQTIKVLGQKQKETNALLQILLEKKHELQIQIRQKQIQAQWINRICFQFQLNKNEASQKWKQCYSKYLEVVQGLFCKYFQKFRFHEGNYFANA